ncbi:MAG: ATP-binding protein, partial [Clostridiales bacterium]|nr:ATP-binding protein [Clostridiales bacterium]
KAVSNENLITRIYEEIHKLLDIATQYGFDKNLWHNYLTFLLITNENPFSITCEKVGASIGKTVNHFAKGDFKIFKKLFDFSFEQIEKDLEIDCFTTICHYEAVGKKERMYNKNVSEKVQALSEKIEQAKDENNIFELVTEFYRAYGVGMFGLNKAFRIVSGEKGAIFQPINNTEQVLLDDLIGYEIQKKKLVDNTKAFVEGREANNCLLFGDAGTGKSTSIKAIINEYYDQGLRMIEIYKHQFRDLSSVIAQIKNRNYRFIIYMDDLSFEEFEIEYKFLKAVIEGGLETKPDNVLIYATSNRRHLIRETWSDRSDMSKDELHRSDTMQEKLSLVSRFGITINYSKPTQKEYYEIVVELAKKYPTITLSEEELCAEANKWELSHGGISGRTAQQFINYLAGKSE